MHSALDPAGIPEVATVRYSIEKSRSTFLVRAFATGLLASFGHNPTISVSDMDGEISFNPDAVEQSALRLVIHTAGMAVTGEMSDKDSKEINRRMHEDVLDSDSFPDIVFQSSRATVSKTGEGQYWLALTGDLTLRGVTRSQSVPVWVALTGDTLRAAGDFSILLSDYEIPPVSAIGGAVKLKDELKLSFSISAVKKI